MARRICVSGNPSGREIRGWNPLKKNNINLFDDFSQKELGGGEVGDWVSRIDLQDFHLNSDDNSVDVKFETRAYLSLALGDTLRISKSKFKISKTDLEFRTQQFTL